MFKLSNKVYDVLKFILMKVVGPTIAFIIGLGELYDFNTKMIVGTIALVATLLSAITGISTYNYNNDGVEPEHDDL